MLKKILFVALLVASVSCGGDEKEVVPALKNDKDIISFRLEVKNNPHLIADINCYISQGRIVGRILYDNVSLNTTIDKSFVPTFTTTGISVRVDTVAQQSGVSSNDLSKPIIYVVEAEDHTTKEYTVQLVESTGLPVIFVSTENSVPIVSKDDYVNGSVFVDASLENTGWNFNGTLQIKGHGNSTWDMPKKPYKIKLSSKAGLLGMPADKEWILLANYADKSLMRTALAFEISNRIGLPYTPRSQYVELFLNGVYQGNYQLTEDIKIATNRVNIVEMGEKDISGNNLTGGYLLEVDMRLGEDFWFYTEKGVAFTIHSPSDILPQQLNYISAYAQQAEDALYGDSFTDPDKGYSNYIDTDSYIKWYLVNELFRNSDAIFYSSVYMYKDRNGKLMMGPVWDFDISAGNINNELESPEGWWVRNSLWTSRLFDDPAFVQKVKNQWALLKDDLVDVNSFIDTKAAFLKRSQYNNFKKWDILGIYVWPNAIVPGSYQGEVDYLKDWMTKRIAWMDSHFTD